jgi:uncharacterized membrane protein YgaE (UPF0421/DUF939 family)
MGPARRFFYRVAVIARPALLLGVAAAIALWISHLIHADVRGLWVVLSAIVVLQSTAPDSLQSSIDRIIGTTVGALVGGCVGLIFDSSSLGVILAVLLAALVCCFIPPLKKTAHVASLTALIVILLPEGSSVQTARHRFVDTLVGIGVALAISALAVISDRWFGYREDPATRKF